MKKDRIKKTLASITINIIIIIFIGIWIIPTLALFINSFRNRADMVTSGWWKAFLHPHKLTFSNYLYVLMHAGILRAFINSIIISIPATILTVIIGAMAAYPISFYKFIGRMPIFIIFIILQIIPIQITLIPVLRMLNVINISGNFISVWIAHTAYGLPFAIYLLRNFFAKIPKSLVESAEIDGAGRLLIFTKLILPLSIPVLITLSIFQFLWVWNDLLVSLVFLGGTPDVAPLTVKITSMIGSLESGWHIKTASAFISMILPLSVFLFLQKYFIKGATAGAIKG